MDPVYGLFSLFSPHLPDQTKVPKLSMVLMFLMKLVSFYLTETWHNDLVYIHQLYPDTFTGY